MGAKPRPMGAKPRPIEAIPRMADRVLTESIPCPRCGVAAGQPCRDTTGATVLRATGTIRVHLGRATAVGGA